MVARSKETVMPTGKRDVRIIRGDGSGAGALRRHDEGRFARACAMVVFWLVLAATAPAAAAPRAVAPNILFILMDNLGYGELGVYGGGITRGAPTPRTDRLASEGLRLTNFNVEAQCTPSRSAIMT